MGRGVLLDKPAQQPGCSRWPPVSSNQKRPSCFHGRPKRSLARAQDPAQTLISRRGPCAGSRRAVRCALRPCHPLAATLALAHWKRLARGSASCFQTRKWRPDGALPPRPPRGRGPGPARSMLVRRIWSCLHRALEALPLPQGSLLLFSVSLPGQLASAPGLLGPPCLVKPPTSRAWMARPLRWLWPVSYARRPCIDARLPEWRRTARW